MGRVSHGCEYDHSFKEKLPKLPPIAMSFTQALQRAARRALGPGKESKVSYNALHNKANYVILRTEIGPGRLQKQETRTRVSGWHCVHGVIIGTDGGWCWQLHEGCVARPKRPAWLCALPERAAWWLRLGRTTIVRAPMGSVAKGLAKPGRWQGLAPAKRQTGRQRPGPCRLAIGSGN